MDTFSAILTERLTAAGIKAEPLAAVLALHWQLVMEANASFNLTAITDNAQAAEKHYQDCLLALPLLEFFLPPGAARRALDIGSGAGFPGLVLAAARPDIRWTLLEATGKKADFLSRAAARMKLENVDVRNTRAEEAGRDGVLRASFDLVTARAVASMPVLAEYALPLLRIGGRLLAYRGKGAAAELEEARNALSLLGGGADPSGITVLELPYGEREFAVVVKREETPGRYPRRAGMPQKRPL